MTPKFQDLVTKLKEIFQLDKPELDFGLYRIMHAKSAEVTDFLEHRLEAKVREALAGNAEAEKQAFQQELDALLGTLQQAGISPESSPKVKDLRDRIAAVGDGIGQAESEVYSHLLTFFSRYYDQGDFISKRRYNGDKYAIPYAGEEVKLHWANADQYYIKSGENFTNYDFTLDGGEKVHFKLVAAATAKDNIKDADAERRFVLWSPEDNPAEDDGEAEPLPTDICEEKDGELFIYFQYRKCKKGTKQTTLIEEAEKRVLDRIAKLQLAMKYPLAVAAPTEKDKNRSLLKKHLERYTAKNTCDYFIHKDLQGFLTRELDFYIKNEMLHLDDLQSADTFRHIERQLRQIQAVRTIAEELIAFMAQLENFQKRLWLKKKFVTRCEWCITMDRLPGDLRAEALANQDQQAEWRKLGFAEPDAGQQARLPGTETGIDARMVDTKFFDEGFKARLLRAIPDIDEQCDGVLIHSENFQALNLLQERYRGQVKCIYIDPPYNTDASEILYKNGYKKSSWNTLLADRLNISKNLLDTRGICAVSIDDSQFRELSLIGDIIFFEQLGVFCIRANPSGRPMQTGYSVSHEYNIFWGNTSQSKIGRMIPTEEQYARFNQKDEQGIFEWRNLRREGSNSDRIARPALYYPIYIKKPNSIRIPKMDWNESKRSWTIVEEPQSDEEVVYPVTDDGKQKTWRWEWKKVIANKDQLAIRKNSSGINYVYVKRRPNVDGVVSVSSWFDAKYSATEHGTSLIKSFFNEKTIFSFPKSLYAVKDTIWISGGNNQNVTVLDYFGGSGTTAHAVIALNREDGGNRKYILVEMGEHFDTVLKPRIEKVVYAPDWKDGKPLAGNKGISHCFKYMTLESYEDALGNIEPADRGAGLPGFLRDEYLVHYMLELDARASLINTDSFKHPFDYKLKIAVDAGGATENRKIDLIETFNYLIGLTVQGQDRHIDKGYVFVKGKLPNGDAALVIWRDVDKVDNATLNRLLDKLAVNPGDTEYAVIYVNGDHTIPNRKLGEAEGAPELKIRQLENVFLQKMFEET